MKPAYALRGLLYIIGCLLLNSSVAQPAITGFSPTSGSIGSSINISGTNFDPIPSNNAVFFGAVRATVTSVSATSLSVIVPVGATNHPISISSNNLTAYSSQPFTVTFPGNTNIISNSFAPTTGFVAGGWPVSISSSDFDGDGKADIATANSADFTVSVLRSTSASGSITFATRLDLTGGWGGGIGLAVGDINSDGKPDIIVVSSFYNKVFVIKNTSIPASLSFSNPVEFVTGTEPYEVNIADFDNDGKPDIITRSGGLFSVLKNQCTSTTIAFASKQDFIVGNNNSSISVSDFDTDGRPDVAIISQNLNKLYVFKNISNAGNIAFNLSADLATGNGPKFSSIADINGDSKTDIAVGNTLDSTVSLFKNNSVSGTISFDAKSDISLNIKPNSILLANINGDGLSDLIVGANTASISIYQNSSSIANFGFLPNLDYAAGGLPANSLVASDLDNDGKNEICNTKQGGLAIGVLRNRLNEPIVTGFTPSGGPSGTPITISGTNFTGATAVNIGQVPVSSFNIQSDSSIAAIVGNGASGSVSVTNFSGSSSLAGFSFGPPPVITSFNPTSGLTNNSIRIRGNNLLGATVSFGGTPATFISNPTDTSLFAVIGSGSSGNIVVTTSKGSASVPGFIYLSPPTISSFAPTSSFSGATITIKGKHFTGAWGVSFGGIPAASFVIVNDSTINAVTGDGASGSISISTLIGTGSTGGYTYLGPNVSSFTPVSGGTGTIVNITGTNFSGATSVAFGGTPASSFSVISPTNITATVANGESGLVTVTSSDGTGSKPGFGFPIKVTGFSPTSAAGGTPITVTGNHFAPTIAGNTVYFGNVKGQVTAASTTSLTVNAPIWGPHLPLVVNANNLSAVSTNFFRSTFSGGDLTTASFAMKQTIASLQNASRVWLADLNNDGKIDVIVGRSDGMISILRNTSTATNVSFSSNVTLTTNTSSLAVYALSVNDLNGDGLLDIVSVNSGSNSVAIFRNSSNSTISFASRINFNTGTAPLSISVADLDGDGKNDIAVANSGSQNISVLKNSSVGGVITFDTKVDISTGNSPNNISIADLDLDGKADLLVTNFSSATMSVLKNNSSNATISFLPKTDLITESFPRDIALGDFDIDGDIDVIVSHSSAQLAVYKNISSSNSVLLEPRITIATKNPSTFMSVNDMNGDGKPDLAVSSNSDPVLGIFKNLTNAGSILFDSVFNYTAVGNYNFIQTGDLDADGKPDIISIDFNGVIFLRNKFNEAPTITSFSPVSANPGDSIIITGNKLTGVTAVSFGNQISDRISVISDKILMAIVGNGAGNTISVSTPYGNAALTGFSYNAKPSINSFSPLSGPPGTTVTIKGNNFNSSASGNIVFFGAVKATVISSSSDTAVTVLVPSGASFSPISLTARSLTSYSSVPFKVTFTGGSNQLNGNDFGTAVSFPTLASPAALALSDYNKDGKADILAACNNGLGVSVLANGSLSPNPLFLPTNNLPAIREPHTISIADFNGDGNPDFATGNMTAVYAITLFKNNGIGGFDTAVQINNTGLGEFHLSTGDFDQDGKPDIVVVGGYSSKVVIFRNTSSNGNISFQQTLELAIGGYLFGVAVGDFDGDGKLDIVAGNSGNGRLTIIRNLSTPGTIILAPKLEFASGGQSSITVGDFDEDGKPDIAKLRDSIVSVFRNTSTTGIISFAARVNLPAASTGTYVTCGDVDGDGKVDLLSTGNTNIHIFKNQSSTGLINFPTKISYPGFNNSRSIAVGDIDGDGKPEISVANASSGKISVLRNQIGEPVRVNLCTNSTSTTLTSNIVGSVYQWEVDSGNGFVDIADDSLYAGSTNQILQLNLLSSSSSGNVYRCMVDGVYSAFLQLKFYNNWTGSTNSSWEDPANWGCEVVPDSNTDVIIATGPVVINSNATVRSLSLSPGVIVNVNAGFTLTITH